MDEEALVIFRRLVSGEPQVYEPDLAGTLNSLGNLLRDLWELETARTRLEEALDIYRRLTQSQPQVFEPHVSDTLNSLGNLLYDLHDVSMAMMQYKESNALCERHRLYLESAETHCNWGLLEKEADNTVRALELFETCVEQCERGLSQLAARKHRDLFKSRIEPTYNRLIEHYSHLAERDRQGTRERLVGLLESLRQVETLTGFAEAASDGTAA